MTKCEADHTPGHSHHHHHHSAQGSIKQALLITLVFFGFEVVGGLYSSSLALLSDAGHMAMDSMALVFALFVQSWSDKPSSLRMSYGYKRAEILGALLSGAAILAMVLGLIYEAISRFRSPVSVHGQVVFWVASAGLVANLMSLKALSHDHKHNLNLKAAYLHVLIDCLGSVGALVSGLVVWFLGYQWIDPAITIVSALLMGFGAYKMLLEAVNVLMESAPAEIDPEEVRTRLKVIPEVIGVHDLHIWSVSSGKMALSVHLISKEGERVLDSSVQMLQSDFGIHHTTIQIEHPERFKSERCFDCANE